MKVHPGDLAVVIKGLWPNIGRIVYVDRFVPNHDFRPIGLGQQDGWRVRAWGQGPLETSDGPRMVGYTFLGSLKPIAPLPPNQALQVAREMALAEFREEMSDLAELLKEQERLHRRRVRSGRRTRKTETARSSVSAPFFVR